MANSDPTMRKSAPKMLSFERVLVLRWNVCGIGLQSETITRGVRPLGRRAKIRHPPKTRQEVWGNATERRQATRSRPGRIHSGEAAEGGEGGTRRSVPPLELRPEETVAEVSQARDDVLPVVERAVEGG